LITIISHFFLFLIIVYYNGLFFFKKFNKSILKNNFFEICFIGLIITLFLAQTVNIFFPLNNYIIYFNLIFIVLFLLKNKKIELDISKKDLLIFVIIFIISIANIYSSGFSDDLNHYHYSSILNADTSNLIWGMSSLHPLFGTSSIWLIGQSYLNFDSTRLQDIHVTNGLIFFIFLSIFFSELLNKSSEKKNYLPILFSLFIFVLIKYTRLKEFGIDRPLYLIFYFLLYYYLKYINEIADDKLNWHFFIFCLVLTSIFYIKVIFLFLLILPLYIFYYKKLDLKFFDSKYYLIVFILFVYLIKNILISGCLVYPVSLSCFDFFPWYNSKAVIEFVFSLEVFNKSFSLYEGSLNSSEYIKNFNWLNTWIVRHKIEIIEFLGTIFLSLILTFLSFSKSSILIKKKFIYKYVLISLFTILFFSVLLFFLKNPNIRMNHHIFIILQLLSIIYLINRFELKIHKKIFILVIIIVLSFNFSKNIKRIHEMKYKNNPVKLISSKIYTQKSYKLNNFEYYVGWYGKGPVSNKKLKENKFKKILIFKIIY